MEEFIGKVWDRYLTKKTSKLHEEARVNFADLSKSLHLFYHLMGGQKGKDLQVTDKRHLNSTRTLLEKISFLGQEFYLTWQDEKSVYLPASLAFFPTKEANEMHYYWLIAMATRTNVHPTNLLNQNREATQFLLQRYLGFNRFYTHATSHFVEHYPNLSFMQSLNELNQSDFLNDTPVPLWIYPAPHQATRLKDEDEIEQSRENAKQIDNLEMKKKSQQINEKKETDGFLSFLPESLMNIMEQVNVDRMEDDSFDEDALYHAEDLDEITLGQKQANLSARIKMDLDLQPDTTEIYPLGKGHFLDEWDYQKESYLKNYVCIKPQVTTNVIPIELPKRLKRTVKKIQNELSLLELDRVKNQHLPYGDEINLGTWIEYKSHQNKSTHHQKFYTSYERQTRDMATLILADVSLSTEAGVNAEQRVIDVIKDGLMVFSDSLERLNDKFAIYTFSSLKNTKIYFNIIKNFKEPHSDLIRGRIESIKTGYYTRLGAGIRESANILAKQKSANKLLLIISDGKPNDVDRYDGRYGIEDTKKAISEVRKRGITPFCITIDVKAKEYLSYLFGHKGYAVVRKGEKLPKILPEIYINLTKD